MKNVIYTRTCQMCGQRCRAWAAASLYCTDCLEGRY